MADLTEWHEVYKEIADNIDNAMEDPPNGADHIYNALLTLINMDSSGNGVAANVTLLTSLNLLYLDSLRHAPWNEAKIRIFITKVNNFTINNVGDLSTFINEVAWHNGCIPFYWWSLSEDAGFDTSTWIKCAS